MANYAVEPEEIATKLDYPSSIALDDQAIYWTEAGSGTVVRANKDGTARQVLATGSESIGKLVLDASYLFWVDNLGGSEPNKRLLRLAK